MNAKHTPVWTPGPWRVSGGRYIKQDYTEIGLSDDAGMMIASIPGGETSGPFFVENRAECDANARLIAAAPELLEALEDCVAVMDRELAGLKAIQPELSSARAAIAKATGEPQ